MEVYEIMSTPPITVRLTDSVHKIQKLFYRHKIASIFVVENGRVEGLVTRKNFFSSKHFLRHNSTAKNVMTRNAYTIHSTAGVDTASDLMIQYGVNSLAVIRSGKIVGVVTRFDFNKRKREHNPPTYIQYTPNPPSNNKSFGFYIFISIILLYLGYTFIYPIIEFSNTSSIEFLIHQKINYERGKYRLPHLMYDSSLQRTADKHSIDMEENNFFDHINKQGKDPAQRLYEQGFSCSKQYGNLIYSGVGENIAKEPIFSQRGFLAIFPYVIWNDKEKIASATVEGWMKSPSHRENILTAHYSSEGIGVHRSTFGEYFYITQNFC
ncbi:CBS domain-containing protein [Candidatus Micrarchaeota archaeon]|nr:CBS domain-containing protein [Candidatus Micrarchaeota archaeon]